MLLTSLFVILVAADAPRFLELSGPSPDIRLSEWTVSEDRVRTPIWNPDGMRWFFIRQSGVQMNPEVIPRDSSKKTSGALRRSLSLRSGATVFGIDHVPRVIEDPQKGSMEIIESVKLLHRVDGVSGDGHVMTSKTGQRNEPSRGRMVAGTQGRGAWSVGISPLRQASNVKQIR